MTEPNSVPEPDWMLRDDIAQQGFAEVLAEYLNVKLYDGYDEDEDEDYPVETKAVLDLAEDLINKLDMLGLKLEWQDEGARLLAEAATYGPADD